MKNRYIKRSLLLFLVLFVMMIVVPFSFASEINDTDMMLMDENPQSNDVSSLSDNGDDIDVNGNLLKMILLLVMLICIHWMEKLKVVMILVAGMI